MARTVIKSPAFTPLDMRDIYRRIVERTGRDFSATVRMFDVLPPFLVGAQHQDVRRTMAAIIASGRERQRETVERKLDELVAALFAADGSFDLVAEFAQPLWYALSAEILGDNGGLDPSDLSALGEDMPTLFSPTASLSKRQAINDEIQAFIDADPANAEPRLVALCLSALGSRPFVGSFALTIFRVVERCGPSAADRIEWPATYSESGLEFVDRVVGDSRNLGETELARGETVRSAMRHDSYTPDEKVQLLFGLGAHACLGKSIAQYAWTCFVERVSQLNTVLRSHELTMKPFSEPFFMPEKAIIAAGDR